MDTQVIEFIVALFVPLLVSVLKRERFSNTVNAAIAIVVYVLSGILAVLFSGQAININDIVPTVAIFVTGGTVAYTAFWKNFNGDAVTATLGRVVAAIRQPAKTA